MEGIFNMISAYLPAGFILIVLGLIVVAEMLKKFTTLPNQLLTTVLPLLGAIVLSIDYIGGNDILEVPALIRQICVGLLLGWAATGGFEWFKNTFLVKSDIVKTIKIGKKEKKEEKNEEENDNKDIDL